jgi:hypothetical protein
MLQGDFLQCGSVQETGKQARTTRAQGHPPARQVASGHRVSSIAFKAHRPGGERCNLRVPLRPLRTASDPYALP